MPMAYTNKRTPPCMARTTRPLTNKGLAERRVQRVILVRNLLAGHAVQPIVGAGSEGYCRHGPGAVARAAACRDGTR